MSTRESDRGALREFLHGARDDLADEFKFTLVTVLFVGAGAGVGYAVAGGGGVVPGGLVGAALLAALLLVFAVRWIVLKVRNGADRRES